MTNKYLRVILLLLLIFSVNNVFAGGPPPPPPPLPIDGGFVGLFALAIGYAVKKINDISKK